MSAGRTKVVLCDLDDTLFDHAAATRAALESVRNGSSWFGGWSLDVLDGRHRELLDLFHVQVLAGRMAIDEARVARFRCLLEEAAVPGAEAAAHDVAAQYRRAYEASWLPVAGALELVRAIRSAGCETVIVTNSTVAEQRQKIAWCGFTDWIDALVTSEEAGTAKPDRRIFDEALARVGASAGDAVMFGDAWATDIEGARRAGVRPVWFNRTGAASPDASIHEVRSLSETSRVLEVLLDPLITRHEDMKHMK